MKQRLERDFALAFFPYQLLDFTAATTQREQLSADGNAVTFDHLITKSKSHINDDEAQVGLL